MHWPFGICHLGSGLFGLYPEQVSLRHTLFDVRLMFREHFDNEGNYVCGILWSHPWKMRTTG